VSVDGGLRRAFREHLRAGWMWTSVETGGTGRGVPDSHYASGGATGWVEFKTESSLGCVGLRPEQVAWLAGYARHGGRAWVAVRLVHGGGPRKGAAADELWLLDGRWAREVRRAGLTAGAPGVAGRWVGGPAGWCWPAVGAVLCGQSL
jgi:hypothetical protein